MGQFAFSLPIVIINKEVMPPMKAILILRPKNPRTAGQPQAGLSGN